MTDANEKLLPCPHCGGSARRASTIIVQDYMHLVGCSQCIIITEWTSKAAATAAWNTRAHPAPKPVASDLEAELRCFERNLAIGDGEKALLVRAADALAAKDARIAELENEIHNLTR